VTPVRALPLAEAVLTDRRRVAVLLEGAGLLSLLDRAGWHLASGWEEARIDAKGRLSVGRDGAAPGRSSRPAQEALLDLAARMFGEGPVAGRGAARRAARVLVDLWRHSLAPVRADDLVTRILEDAALLWELPELAPARGSLGGAFGRALWVAGPRAFRARVLARCGSEPELRALLASPEARDLWEGEDRRPDALERAAALAARGRAETALEALAGLDSPPARALAAHCLHDLGRLAAARAMLRSLEEERLEPVQVAGLADLAARVHASHGRPGRAGFWVRRALDESEGDPHATLHARLAAAGAAWDRGDFEALERFLASARGALGEPALEWRWRQLRALLDHEAGRREEAAAEAARAIRAGRRILARRDAAGLWNDLGLARAGLGDLPGAERAFLHASRLAAGCHGPRLATLCLFNLAEIRVRSGRLAGVREIAARSEAENRRSGNLRGLAADAELWARYELALGRAEAALDVCERALREIEEWRTPWPAVRLHLLAARALGWLGRPGEAASRLAQVPEEILEDLEPEERPAVLALAGDREGALRMASASPLWQALLEGRTPPSKDWEALSGLSPWRAARLVFDFDQLAPGAVPESIRRDAVTALRKAGSDGLAERLEDGKPADAWMLASLLLSRNIAVEEPPPPPSFRIHGEEIAGESPALIAALDRLAKLAPGDMPVLILGESGTGKELAAKRLHRGSRRASRPFVPLNCAATSETLLLSELFGHVRGAYTGADRDRKGVFETADGGTVFLDEIGDLPLNAQGMLLRVLQEGEVRPVGESRSRKVNVRVLAATHRDLSAMVEQGTFRRDLFFRLKVGSVTLPPLRERGEDVLIIADRFLGRVGSPSRLTREARAVLLAHDWPGNVRELENVLSVAVALAEGAPIAAKHLELPRPAETAATDGSYHQRIEALRREMIIREMERCGGNRTAAARRLGLSRQSLSYLLRQLGILK
jgi:DNA-binding NtrC family response regulator